MLNAVIQVDKIHKSINKTQKSDTTEEKKSITKSCRILICIVPTYWCDNTERPRAVVYYTVRRNMVDG